MVVFRVGSLPDDPLAASAAFYAQVLPQVLAELQQCATQILLPPAGGARGGPVRTQTSAATDSPPTSPASGRGECLTLIFAPAAHAHRDWREAAIATLARAQAPNRINGIASDDEPAIAAALAYLDSAGGITGQYLPLDSVGAGSVLG